MSNKKLGNDFEQEFCEILSYHGFWCHNLAQNKAGQPADVIAVKNGLALLIDCKVCSSRGFALSRIEENQHHAMELWSACGNHDGWFALKLSNGDIYMTTRFVLEGLGMIRSTASEDDIIRVGLPFREWVDKVCK